MAVTAYLYDADREDRQISPDDVSKLALSDHSLLWIDADQRDDPALGDLIDSLGLDAEVLSHGPSSERPQLSNYGTYFQFTINAAPQHDDGRDESIEAGRGSSPDALAKTGSSPIIDFLVSKQVLVTVHDGPVACLTGFREQDKAQTKTGLLSAQVLAAALLDWHLSSFFDEVSRIEAKVDELDDRMLRESANEMVLGRMVAMRRRVSKLRSLLVAQRDVFYGLSRPDIALLTDETATSYYATLPSRFERALDEVERARDLATGSFELFTSRSGETTNALVKILTFVTTITGFCAAVAGLLGMNFQLSIFNTGYAGFLVVTGGLCLISAASVIFARRRRWV
jgi:Mg2+ and Co2+ transporter CorA